MCVYGLIVEAGWMKYPLLYTYTYIVANSTPSAPSHGLCACACSDGVHVCLCYNMAKSNCSVIIVVIIRLLFLLVVGFSFFLSLPQSLLLFDCGVWRLIDVSTRGELLLQRRREGWAEWISVVLQAPTNVGIAKLPAEQQTGMTGRACSILNTQEDVTYYGS